MKKLFLFLLIIPFFSIAQNLRGLGLDRYKYLVLDKVSSTQDNKEELLNKLKLKGYNVLDIDNRYPEDLRKNPSLGLYITYKETCIYNEASNVFEAAKGSYDCKASFRLYTNEEILFYQSGWEGVGSSSKALEKTLKPILNYKYKFKPVNDKKQTDIKFNDVNKNRLNNYANIVTMPIRYENGDFDINGFSNLINIDYRRKGFNVFDFNNLSIYDEKKLKNNSEAAITLYANHSFSSNGTERTATVILTNIRGEEIYKSSGSYASNRFKHGISMAFKRAMDKFRKTKYQFNPKRGISSENLINYDLSNLGINSQSEESVIEYLDKKRVNTIEGIWELNSDDDKGYRLAIIEEGNKFVATIIDGNVLWMPGQKKATFETAATDEIVTINWIMNDKRTNKKVVGTVTNNALIEFNLSAPLQLYKVYPKLGKKKKTKTGEWAGNGSGLIISKSGYIVTNHHVIEDADNIEVEFIIDGEVNKFNAEIVQVDKTNDLAIIKIFDMNFDGLDDLPYNFKTRSSDVGTKVYAYGYPMALSLMGKEIKITDGIISSKSGFDGDITTYQITAPIQGGNSGGPLFDEKGNFLGINSSGLRKDIADNVGYSIKSSYVLNLIDVLPKSIELPSNTKLQSLPLTEQIKEISKYVVLVKVK